MSAFEKKVPVFGICFGHQLIAHHFGGTVQFLNSKKQKRLGLQEMAFPRSVWAEEGKKRLFCSHNEIVATVPNEMSVWGSSQKVKIEGLSHKSLPVWTIQAHPEATVSFAEQRGISLKSIDLSDGSALISQFLKYCE